MSIYVVDTNVYSHALNQFIPFDVFNYIWEPWSTGMKEGYILSVDEAYNELSIFWDPEKCKDKYKRDTRTEQGKWLKLHKDCFLPMSEAECHSLAHIFISKKFQEGIKEDSLRLGTPEADAILVAKAKHIGGIVVTNESNSKPNSEKIPNICVALDVPYTTRPQFYRILKNLYTGQPEHENVIIYHTLLDYAE
jgi:hypothetical protein